MDEYNAALESFREKNKDCIVKQLDYGECMQNHNYRIGCGISMIP